MSDQLVDFLESTGSAELAKLRKFVNTVSPVGISDGNPYSTTALTARSWVDAFTEARNLSTTETDKTRLSIDYGQSTYTAGLFAGTLTLSVTYPNPSNWSARSLSIINVLKTLKSSAQEPD